MKILVVTPDDKDGETLVFQNEGAMMKYFRSLGWEGCVWDYERVHIWRGQVIIPAKETDEYLIYYFEEYEVIKEENVEND